MTAGIVIALTFYSFTTRTDFTSLGGIMSVIVAIFAILGLFTFMFGPALYFIWCAIGVAIFGIYLVIDT